MTEVKRDRWGRPLIALPDGSGDVAYKRASSYGKPLDDMNNLIAWKQRITALGLVRNPSLQLEISAAGDDRKALNAAVNKAFLAGGGETKADIGTALHKLCERHDLGEDLGFIPETYRNDIEAYKRETGGFKWLQVEQFVVNDELRAAGTPDRIGHRLMTDQNYIVDLKTGGIGFPHGFSVQLGIYAHSKNYDPATGERSDLPPVNQEWAILIHLPAGEGRCDLYWLNIADGYRAASLARDVDAWRKTDNLTIPFAIERAAA